MLDDAYHDSCHQGPCRSSQALEAIGELRFWALAHDTVRSRTRRRRERRSRGQGPRLGRSQRLGSYPDIGAA